MSLPLRLFAFRSLWENNTNNQSNEGTRARMFYVVGSEKAESYICSPLVGSKEEILYPSEVSLINQQHVCAGIETLRGESVSK